MVILHVHDELHDNIPPDCGLMNECLQLRLRRLSMLVCLQEHTNVFLELFSCPGQVGGIGRRLLLLLQFLFCHRSLQGIDELFPGKREGESVASSANSMPSHVSLFVEKVVIVVARLHGEAKESRDARARADHLHHRHSLVVENSRGEARPHFIRQTERRQLVLVQMTTAEGAERCTALLAQKMVSRMIEIGQAHVIFGAAYELHEVFLRGVIDEGSPLVELICVGYVGIAVHLPVLLLESVHADEILCSVNRHAEQCRLPGFRVLDGEHPLNLVLVLLFGNTCVNTPTAEADECLDVVALGAFREAAQGLSVQGGAGQRSLSSQNVCNSFVVDAQDSDVFLHPGREHLGGVDEFVEVLFFQMLKQIGLCAPHLLPRAADEGAEYFWPEIAVVDGSL